MPRPSGGRSRHWVNRLSLLARALCLGRRTQTASPKAIAIQKWRPRPASTNALANHFACWRHLAATPGPGAIRRRVATFCKTVEHRQRAATIDILENPGWAAFALTVQITAIPPNTRAPISTAAGSPAAISSAGRSIADRLARSQRRKCRAGETAARRVRTLRGRRSTEDHTNAQHTFEHLAAASSRCQ